MSDADAAPSASAAAVRQLGTEAAETMQAALEALTESRDSSATQPSRQQLQGAVALLQKEAATVGLYFHGNLQAGSEAPASEVAPLLANFQRSVALLCMLYMGLSSAAGPTLRKSVLQTATSLVEACSALVKGATAGSATEEQLLLLSGYCLEMCQAAGRAPLDNKSAIGRAVTLVLKQLADAARELQEVAAEAEAEAAAGAGAEVEAQLASLSVSDSSSASASGATGTAGPAEHAAGQANGGPAAAAAAAAAAEATTSQADSSKTAEQGEEEQGHEQLSSEQLALVKGAHTMLACTITLLKALVRVLLAQPPELPNGGCEGWESLLFHIRALAAAADDLAAAVYMEDIQEVESAAAAVANGCELIVDEIVPEPSEEQQAELAAALESVQAAQGALTQLLAAADS